MTQDFIERNGVADQVSTQGGDFTKNDFPQNCDVAVMASNLPQYNREIINQVIQKAFDALLPGGEMHLIGEMLDDDRKGTDGRSHLGIDGSHVKQHGTGAQPQRLCAIF